MTGEAGVDYRGLWTRDDDTGTNIRVGSIGYELAEAFTTQGNYRAACEALRKPPFGAWFSKTF